LVLVETVVRQLHLGQAVPILFSALSLLLVVEGEVATQIMPELVAVLVAVEVLVGQPLAAQEIPQALAHLREIMVGQETVAEVLVAVVAHQRLEAMALVLLAVMEEMERHLASAVLL
jgi:hypothetical protein